MIQQSFSQVQVLDLVPFGNTTQDSAFFALRLSLPAWKGYAPGQFVMIRPSAGWSKRLWARPFSICRLSKRDLVVFFQVVGEATSDLARLVPGDTLEIWGPLGNGLCMEKNTKTLLLAGGIGIAPFVGYVHEHPAPWNLAMEFGLRTDVSCYPVDSLNEKIEVEVHMERNQQDREAFVLLLEKRIAEYAEDGLVLACGPKPFLQTVQSLALKYNTRTQLCLETLMACGIGACLGCVVKAKPSNMGETPALTNEGHVQTCTCGPSFWADSVTL